jgi:hypothetical protein
MSKQDRQPVRNVTGLERKYDIGKSFAELRGAQAGTQANMQSQAKNTAAELANRIKYDEFNRIVAMLNAATDVLNLKNRLSVESDKFTLSEDGTVTINNDNFTLSEDGTVTATAGTFGTWIIETGSDFNYPVFRSPYCVSGTIKYGIKTVKGYIFTVLAKSGLFYVVKQSADYASTTVDKISPFQSPTFSNIKFDEDGDGVFA